MRKRKYMKRSTQILMLSMLLYGTSQVSTTALAAGVENTAIQTTINVEENKALKEQKVIQGNIELKDVTSQTIYHVKEDGSLEEVSILDITKGIPTDMNNYYVVIEMEDLPDFYANIKEFRKEDNKLVAVIEHKDLVQYAEDGTKTTGSYTFAISYKDSEGEHGIIKDAADFFKEIEKDLKGSYTLTEDLDASNISESQAAILGTFTGTIDGQGHKIVNLKTNLFDKVSKATIKNLVIENANITTNKQGILANSIENNSVIENTFIVDSSIKNNANQMGAFAGVLNNSTIKSSAAINISIKGNNTIGGIVGQTSSNAVIENCYVTGNLEGTIYHTLGARVGGITGWHSGKDIKNCITNVTIKAQSKTGNGGIIGGPNSANPSITSSLSIANGAASKVAGFNVLANAKEVYEYKNGTATTNINNSNKDKVKETTDIYSKEFYKDTLKFDEAIWNLDVVKEGTLPTLKADPTPNSVVEYEIQENKNNIPNYRQVRNHKDYRAENEIVYANMAKLMPFASVDEWIAYGNNINKDSQMSTKSIQFVLPVDSKGSLVTGVEKDNSNAIAKIILVYEDANRQELSVQYKGLMGDLIAAYEISDLGLSYQFHNYVVDMDENLKKEVLELANSFDYETDIASVTSETESRLYTDYYNENVKAKLDDVITKLLLSGEFPTYFKNEAVQKQVKEQLLNKENLTKTLYAFNYYDKWYHINFGGVNLSDMMFFNGGLIASDMTREELTSQLLSSAQNLRATGSTYDFYQKVLQKYTGKEMMSFLSYMAEEVAGYENASDWFVNEFDGILKEQSIEGKEDTINYRIWDILDNLGTRKKIVLPMLTAPQEDMYLISMPSQLVIGSMNRYPQYLNKDGQERERMKSAIDSYAQRLERFYGTSSNWMGNSANLLNSFVNIQYDTRFSFPSSEHANSGTQNSGSTKDPVMKWVYEAIGSFGAANGSAAYANGTDVYWIAEAALGGEYAFSIFSHETAHNQDGRYFYGGNGRRSGTGPEAHADGNIAQQIGDGSMVFNISTVKDIASDVTNNFSYERIDSADKIQSYYKEMFETGYVLDYLQGQAFLQLTPEQQSKVAVQAVEQKDGSSIKITYKQLSAEEFKAMNLQTMEDLWDNKIALKAPGTYGSSSYGTYGYESFYEVNWYQVHNDNGTPDSSSFKRLSQEMLGIGGYENGYMTYISGKSKNDLDALRKITGKEDITWKSYKLGRYETVKENLDKIPYFNSDEVIAQFKQALEQDAKSGNTKRNNSIAVKRTLFGIVKRATDDFSNGSVYEAPEVISVSSAKQLVELVKENPAGYYKLAGDIDFTGISAQDGAYITDRFIGVLDGDGHNIKGMKYTLFNQMIYAQVKNVTILQPSYEAEAVAYLAKNSKNVTIDTVRVDGADMTLPMVKTKTGTYYEYGTVEASVRAIEIDSVEDFLAIGSSEVAKKKNYQLVADLDFTNVNASNFVISGTFSGKIDGNGHVISNVNRTVFEKLQNATITNLGIKDSKLTNGSQKGIFANNIASSTIEKVYMKDSSLSNNTNQVGGFAGVIANSTVKEVSLENVFVKSNNTIGGVAGQIDNSKVEDIIVTGKIEGTIYHDLGARIGGVTGWVGTGTTLKNVYTKVEIVAPQAIGNGGIIGGPNNRNVSIANAIALTTGTNAKQIAGWNVLSNTSNVYQYAGSTSGKNTVAGNLEASEEQVKTESFYTENLKFSADIWDVSDVTNGGTPKFKNALTMFEADKIAPEITGVENDKLYKEAVTPVITDEHLSTVVVTKDGETVEYKAEMSFTEDGKYIIVATDESGNETTVTFEIDTTAPVIAEVENDNIYNVDVTPVITDNNLETVTIVKDGVEVSYTDKMSITEDGAYKITAVDKAGNESSLSFSIDKTAPVIEATVSSDAKFWENYAVTFKDAGAGIAEVKWDIDEKTVEDFKKEVATIEVKDEKQFTETLAFYKNSTYTFYVKDKAGNETVYVLHTSEFINDTKAPVITGVENGGLYKEAVTPVITDENLKTVTVLKDNVEVEYKAGMSFTEDGEYKITAVDKVENQTSIAFVIDKTAPTIEVKLTSNNKYWESYEVSFNDAGSGIAEVKWDIDEKRIEDFKKEVGVIEVKDEEAFSETLTFYKNSAYTFYVKDHAGNEYVYVLHTSKM